MTINEGETEEHVHAVVHFDSQERVCLFLDKMFL